MEEMEETDGSDEDQVWFALSLNFLSLSLPVTELIFLDYFFFSLSSALVHVYHPRFPFMFHLYSGLSFLCTLSLWSFQWAGRIRGSLKSQSVWGFSPQRWWKWQKVRKPREIKPTQVFHDILVREYGVNRAK